MGVHVKGTFKSRYFALGILQNKQLVAGEEIASAVGVRGMYSTSEYHTYSVLELVTEGNCQKREILGGIREN